MPITSPLTNPTAGRISQKDLDSYLNALAREPKATQQAEVKKLLDAGEARLPEGATTTLYDIQWQLQNDAWDPSKKMSFTRPAPAKLSELKVERELSQDGTAVGQNLFDAWSGKAEPGAQVQILNMSRNGTPAITNVTAGADGAFTIRAAHASLFFNEQLAVRVKSPRRAR